MSNKRFQFKKFAIHQDKCAMKIGTDGVLLPCWIPEQIISTSKKILDIGTGTGLIALILAQRANNNHFHIDALEIDNEAANQAENNFNSSSWHKQISTINQSLIHYQTTKKYDLIVSNPPYFENSLKSNQNNKNLARHTDSLSFKDLIESSANLQLENSYLAIVIPYSSYKKMKDLAIENNYQLIEHCKVKPTPEKNHKRSLMLFQKTNSDIETTISELIIEDKGRHQYSDAYIHLTKDFYLKM